MSSRPLERTAGRSQAASGPEQRTRRRQSQTRRDRVVRIGRSVGRLLSRGVTAVAFWVAVVLPLLALVVLVGGLETRVELVAFVSLVTLSLVAFGVGHQYHHPTEDRDETEQ